MLTLGSVYYGRVSSAQRQPALRRSRCGCDIGQRDRPTLEEVYEDGERKGRSAPPLVRQFCGFEIGFGVNVLELRGGTRIRVGGIG